MCIAPDAVHFRLPNAACTSLSSMPAWPPSILLLQPMPHPYFPCQEFTQVHLTCPRPFFITPTTLNFIISLSSHTKKQVLTAKSFSVSTLVTPLNSTFHLLLLLLSGGDVCVTLWLSESWGLPVNLSSYVCCVHMHVSVY